MMKLKWRGLAKKGVFCVALIVLCVMLFHIYLRYAYLSVYDSDSAANLLMARDILAGNWGLREEAIVLLGYGGTEREIKHWDFSLVLTEADLTSHYKPYALAAVSRSMEVAVVSTSRIDPETTGGAIPGERVSKMAHRIEVLVLHALGHLIGIHHETDPSNYMSKFEALDELDRADEFNEQQIEAMRSNLGEVADQRLEERMKYRRISAPKFYLRAAWINRRDIFDAILQAKPWQFPFRLSRLTTAAISTMFVLMVTAEAWDLGMSQKPSLLVGLSIVAIVATTVYILVRQRLLVRRHRRRITEQNVVSNLTTVAIVLLGMAWTWLMLLAVTFAAALLLFSRSLVQTWITSVKGPFHTVDYLALAAFVASLGIIIGALGASFERQNYFRHITYVDEEL